MTKPHLWRWALVPIALLSASEIAAQTSEPVDQQQGVELTPGELLALAAQLLQAGAPNEARGMAEALLQRDPQDQSALVILAQAAFMLGDFTTARTTAARLYRLQSDPSDRYNTARLAALAAANEERYTLSTWWLRRALTQAPTPQAREETMRDASNVSSANPWTTSLTLSIAPSDNVNGGSRNEDLIVDGITTGSLSADAQALDGWAGTLRASTSYRLAETPQSQSFVGARLSWYAVALSDGSSDIIREANASDVFGRVIDVADFSYGSFEAYYSQNIATQRGPFGVEVAAGARWQGQERDHNFARLSVNQSILIDENTLFRGSAFLEQQWKGDERNSDNRRLGSTATFVRALEDIGTVSGTLSYSTTLSDSTQDQNEIWSIYAGFSPSNQIGPLELSLQVGYQQIDYPNYLTFIGPGVLFQGRDDSRTFASLSAALPDYSFAGFEPVITIDASKTDSNVSRFSQDSVNLGLTFQSSF